MNKIEKQVMAGVAVIYTARALISATALKLYALVVAVWALGVLVWVARVEQNFAEALRGGLPKVLPYIETAVLHTTIFVQLALAVVLFMLFSLALDLTRKLSAHRRLAY